MCGLIKFTSTGAINVIPRSSSQTGRPLRNIHFSNGNECVPFYISWSGWPLRYIHISNDNGSFTFYVDLFLSSITAKTFTGLDCIWATQWVCYRRQELRTLHDHPSQPQFLVGPVLLIFLVFCVVILLCLSPCCVLSHDCLFYGLSMFDFTFTFFYRLLAWNGINSIPVHS
jgi:hypothetical protein